MSKLARLSTLLEMPTIKEAIDFTKEITGDCWDAIKTIAKFFNYLMNPGLIFQALWNSIQAYAYWICLVIALFSLIAYIAGFKKYARLVPGSFIVFALIKAIGSVF